MEFEEKKQRTEKLRSVIRIKLILDDPEKSYLFLVQWMIRKYERKPGTKPIDDWLLVKRGSSPRTGQLESG